MAATFTVDRIDLRRTHWIDAAATPLDDGAVRLRIDRFALTANNITYGAFGVAMSYWNFFPTGNAATGCIPVWGFATVSESKCAGIEVGERVYGYFPMSDEVMLHPDRVDAAGFVDGAAHRRALHGVYNKYLRCSSDPLYRPADEALLALLRPLFMTSFLIDDFLADNAFFGARTILVSSASSKTAYGLGFCLAERRGRGETIASVGLTSPRNLEFTRGLGCYDQVASYAEVTRLAADEPAVYVDMSGDAPLRAAIHGHWGDRLAYSCSVGGTHWEDLGSGKGLPGPRPVLFFAPAQVKKRLADWGAAGLQDRLATAWAAFLARVRDPARPWLTVVEGRGRQAVEASYSALLEGTVPANEGRILAV
ncbi:MAG: DUF2855 family protein [Caldimonas sp.]